MPLVVWHAQPDVVAIAVMVPSISLVLAQPGTSCLPPASRPHPGRTDMEDWMRVTISSDRAAFPCLQAWVDGASRYWWDLDYLYQALQAAGESDRRHVWVQHLEHALGGEQILSEERHLHVATHVRACTTLAKVTFYWHALGVARKETLRQALVGYLRGICARACKVAAAGGEDVFVGAAGAVRILRGGQVQGFLQLRAHASVWKSLRMCWESLQAVRVLDGHFQQDTHALSDILTLAALYQRWKRRSRLGSMSGQASALVSAMHDALLPWVARCADKYIQDIYSPLYPTSLQPPSLGSRLAAGASRKVKASFVWNLIHHARRVGVSLRAALALRSDDDDAGCHPSSAAYWVAKHQEMYFGQQDKLFNGEPVHHINIVADAATHSCREVLVSVGYTWELDAACYPPVQVILPGGDITWQDHPLPAELAIKAAQGKLQRVAAFRQLQALGNLVSVAALTEIATDFSPRLYPNVESCAPEQGHHSKGIQARNTSQTAITHLAQ